MVGVKRINFNLLKKLCGFKNKFENKSLEYLLHKFFSFAVSDFVDFSKILYLLLRHFFSIFVGDISCKYKNGPCCTIHTNFSKKKINVLRKEKKWQVQTFREIIIWENRTNRMIHDTGCFQYSCSYWLYLKLMELFLGYPF